MKEDLEKLAEPWNEENLKGLRNAVREHIRPIGVPEDATIDDLAAILTQHLGFRVLSSPQDIEATLGSHLKIVHDDPKKE